jgi:ribose transport system permease protein
MKEQEVLLHMSVNQSKFITFLKKNSTIMIFLILVFLIFFLTDILKIGNEGGTWIFLNVSNIRNILNQVSINAIIAFGMTLVILVNGIDLSVGSMVAVAGVVLAVFFIDLNVPLVISYLIVILTCAVVGSINGLLVTKVKMPAFIVTLGSMQIFRGLAFIFAGGQAKFTPDPKFQIVGNTFLFNILPISILVMLFCFAFFHVFLTKTKFGRCFYFTGQNDSAAFLTGVNIDKVRIIAYTLVGAASGVSGILLASRLGSGSPNVGVAYEMDAIAAVVVGGTSFTGGVGTIKGTLIGAMILGVISNGLNLLGVSPFAQQLVRGVIILLAVLFDTINRGGK